MAQLKNRLSTHCDETQRVIAPLYLTGYVRDEMKQGPTMKTLSRFLMTAVSAAAISGAAYAQTPTRQAQPVSANAHGIAAVVNSDIITTHDLRQRVLFMLATTGVQRDEASLQRVQAQAMRNLIDEHLQMQEAEKFEQTIRDEEVNRSVARLIGRNGLDPEEVVARLAATGVSIETLRDQVRSEIAWQRIVNGLFGQRIRISDTVIDETLARITANSSEPSYNIAEIYIEATPDIGGQDGAMEGARALIGQLEQGAPFPLLAQQFSSAPSAASGGQIGWVQDGDIRPEIGAVLDQLGDGEVSNPIAVPGGVYLVALLDKRISETDTLYRLRQISAEGETLEDASALLQSVRANITDCDSVRDAIDDVDGLATADMGSLKASEMNDVIRSAIENTDVNEISAPIERPNGATSIMVCKRETTGSGIPTRDEIENRLMDTQLAQASRRHLRDLRRKATISVRS